MEIIDIKIRKLLEQIENFETQSKIEDGRKEIAEQILLKRLSALNGEFSKDAIYSALCESRFCDAEKLCNEILPTFGQEGKTFANFYRLFLTYFGFKGSTKSEKIANAFKETSTVLTNLKNTYGDNYSNYTSKLLNANRSECIYQCLSNIAPTLTREFVEETVWLTDEYVEENSVKSLNEILVYRIKTELLLESKSILNEANNILASNQNNLEDNSDIENKEDDSERDM